MALCPFRIRKKEARGNLYHDHYFEHSAMLTIAKWKLLFFLSLSFENRLYFERFWPSIFVNLSLFITHNPLDVFNVQFLVEHLLAGQGSSEVACGRVYWARPLYQPKWRVRLCCLKSLKAWFTLWHELWHEDIKKILVFLNYVICLFLCSCCVVMLCCSH